MICWQGHAWLEVRLRAQSAELLKYFINPSNNLPTCCGMQSVFSPAWITTRSAGCLFSAQFSTNVFILFSVLLVVTLKCSWLCRKGLSPSRPGGWSSDTWKIKVTKAVICQVRGLTNVNGRLKCFTPPCRFSPDCYWMLNFTWEERERQVCLKSRVRGDLL